MFLMPTFEGLTGPKGEKGDKGETGAGGGGSFTQAERTELLDFKNEVNMATVSEGERINVVGLKAKVDGEAAKLDTHVVSSSAFGGNIAALETRTGNLETGATAERTKVSTLQNTVGSYAQGVIKQPLVNRVQSLEDAPAGGSDPDLAAEVANIRRILGGNVSWDPENVDSGGILDANSVITISVLNNVDFINYI